MKSASRTLVEYSKNWLRPANMPLSTAASVDLLQLSCQSISSMLPTLPLLCPDILTHSDFFLDVLPRLQGRKSQSTGTSCTLQYCLKVSSFENEEVPPYPWFGNINGPPEREQVVEELLHIPGKATLQGLSLRGVKRRTTLGQSNIVVIG